MKFGVRLTPLCQISPHQCRGGTPKTEKYQISEYKCSALAEYRLRFLQHFQSLWEYHGELTTKIWENSLIGFQSYGNFTSVGAFPKFSVHSVYKSDVNVLEAHNGPDLVYHHVKFQVGTSWTATWGEGSKRSMSFLCFVRHALHYSLSNGFAIKVLEYGSDFGIVRQKVCSCAPAFNCVYKM